MLELQNHREGVDFASLDGIVSRGHRVIVYSHVATDEVILTALDRGAVTYLTKSERKDHLIDAIRAAGTDTPYVGPRMARAMLNDGAGGRANLAPREKEVLIAWFRTESKDIVARQLQIAPTTVRTHSAASAGEVCRGGATRHNEGRVGGAGDSGRHCQRRRHLVGRLFAGRVPKWHRHETIRVSLRIPAST